MPKDKPGFLQNVGDDAEEKEILSVLQDDPETPDTPESKETSPDESKKETSSDTTGKDTTEDKKPDSTETPPVNTEAKPTEKSKVKGKEKEEKTDAKTEEEPLIMGKYKTQEEFEKAHLELQRSFSRLENQVKSTTATKGKDELELFKKTPVIKSQIPDPKHYYFKNDEGEEVFDIGAFMKDTLSSYSVAIQQNLLGGPFASAMYSLLGKALMDEQGSALENSRNESRAATIWDNVQKSFPVLAKDMNLQSLFERAIYGEKTKRIMEAKAKGQEPTDLTEEDYMALAKTLVMSYNPQVPEAPVEPTEKPKGGVALKGEAPAGGSIDAEIDRNIEDMMASKRKQLF